MFHRSKTVCVTTCFQELGSVFFQVVGYVRTAWKEIEKLRRSSCLLRAGKENQWSIPNWRAAESQQNPSFHIMGKPGFSTHITAGLSSCLFSVTYKAFFAWDNLEAAAPLGYWDTGMLECSQSTSTEVSFREAHMAIGCRADWKRVILSSLGSKTSLWT